MRLLLVNLAALSLAMSVRALGPTTQPHAATKPAPGDRQVPVTFTGGFDTDPRDHGRPVILVASALGVTADVFRDALSHVTPAADGRAPEPEQVRKNKRALLDALSKYGVTND